LYLVYHKLLGTIDSLFKNEKVHMAVNGNSSHSYGATQTCLSLLDHTRHLLHLKPCQAGHLLGPGSLPFAINQLA